jgi:hypothetical protein
VPRGQSFVCPAWCIGHHWETCAVLSVELEMKASRSDEFPKLKFDPKLNSIFHTSWHFLETVIHVFEGLH